MSKSAPFATSPDGTVIHATQYGSGPPLVIVHGGLGEAAHWNPVGELLASRHRIVGVERRLYGHSGIPQSPHSMAREAEDIAAVLSAIGEPAIIVGHSSGGVATLEAALLRPPHLAGLVLYEPPLQAEAPIGGAFQAAAEAALAAGDADRALEIFFADIVGFPAAQIAEMRSPKWRGGWEFMMSILPAQLEDNRAIRALPLGVERYRPISTPTLLLRGSDSPAHLHLRLKALAAILPNMRIADLPGQGHNANMSAPQMVADAITGFAGEVFG